MSVAKAVERPPGPATIFSLARLASTSFAVLVVWWPRLRLLQASLSAVACIWRLIKITPGHKCRASLKVYSCMSGQGTALPHKDALLQRYSLPLAGIWVTQLMQHVHAIVVTGIGYLASVTNNQVALLIDRLWTFSHGSTNGNRTAKG